MVAARLQRPIHLALSYDEEVGCIGVGRMIRDMQDIGVAPGICIVGEPSSMQVVSGHKGKLAMRAHVCGREAHSALAPYAVNALEYAAEMIVQLRRMQREKAAQGPFNREYDPPYTTLHTGVLHGGTALNIVPRECSFDFEIRNIPEDDPQQLLRRFEAHCARELLPQMRKVAAESSIAFETMSREPGAAQRRNRRDRRPRRAPRRRRARRQGRVRLGGGPVPACRLRRGHLRPRARSATRTSPTNSSPSISCARARRSSRAWSAKRRRRRRRGLTRVHLPCLSRGSPMGSTSFSACRRAVARHRALPH